VRRVVSWIAALAVPVLLLAGPLAADDKKADKDKDLEKPAEKLIKVGTVTGKVMAVYEDKRKVRLEISYQVMKINPGAVNSMQQARLAMVQATNIIARIQAQQQMAQAQRTLYTTETKKKEMEFQAIDDVVVRTAKPRDTFDDKGKIKKFTKAELKELKGPDRKVPGYKAEFGDLTADQILQLTIVRKKSDPAPKPKPKPKGKKKDDDALDAELLDDAPQVSLILIVADPPPSK
jgi:hypothetical protein